MPMADAQNQLIERLPRKERLRLLALCKPVQRVLGEAPCEPGQEALQLDFERYRGEV